MAPVPWHRRNDGILTLSGLAIILAGLVLPFPWHYPVLVGLSCIGCGTTFWLIPACRDLFIKAGIFGRDLNKPQTGDKEIKVPEALGVVVAVVYLILLFCYIPFYFRYHLLNLAPQETFPYPKFVGFICGLLSICCMAFLGFADDVLDLRWRDKLLLPTVASLPLLMVYHVTYGSTVVVVPIALQQLLGQTLDLGPLFYIYMGMLAVFCTNAINIYAGINGIEAGQSLVIGVSLVINSLFQVLFTEYHDGHQLALCMLLPFCGVTAALVYHNWYPAQVFVGDTFCYFAGMTFAVSGILGHFSKTLLLFFLPQIFNFLLSVPQLFKLVPCPRHRMPRLDQASGKLTMSYAVYKPEALSSLSALIIKIVTTLGLCDARDGAEGLAEISNFTIINVALKLMGPTAEDVLTTRLLLFQGLCSIVAFAIRYLLAGLLFEQPSA